MRVRTIGFAPVGALCLALIIMLVMPTVAVDRGVPVRSDDTMLVQSAPVLVEPHQTRIAQAMPAGFGSGIQHARNISLDFHGADISDVLKALSLQSGTNIVTGTDVKGQITVSLNRVALGEALDTITRLSGYRYAMTNSDTYIVGTTAGVRAFSQGDSLEPETEVVVLQYANCDNVAKTIQELISDVKAGVTAAFGTQATMGDDKKDQVWDVTAPGEWPKMRTKPAPIVSRLLLLTGPRQAVAAAKDLALKMDEAAKTAGGSVVTEIYEPKYSEATELAQVATNVSPTVTVTLGPTTNFQLEQDDVVKGAGDGKVGTSGKYEFKAQPTSIVLTGPAEDVERAIQTLEQVDTKPEQILITARILDVNNDDAKNLGLIWSWSDFTFSEGTKSSGAGNGDFIRLPIDISAKLEAMITNGKAKLLANPSTAAVEGKPANVFIGDEITYVLNIQQTTTGQNITTATALVGIQLRAIGLVGPNDEITLNLHPEVSVVSSFLKLDNGIALPQIARRFADSTIRVKSGETIAIGGLIRDQDIAVMSKIPLLGDLPFFGGLFRHRTTTKQHSEVTVLLTATVLKDA